MASLPPLVETMDLKRFPGSPFDDAAVKSAAASVRSEAGWHIAPEVSQTVVVESDGGKYLFLRTLHLSAVDEARDITDPDNPIVLDGVRDAKTDTFVAGCVTRTGGWPAGVIELDITHGFDECPAELLPVVAGRCQQEAVSAAIAQEASATESATYRSPSNGARPDPRVQRYKVRSRP